MGYYPVGYTLFMYPFDGSSIKHDFLSLTFLTGVVLYK